MKKIISMGFLVLFLIVSASAIDFISPDRNIDFYTNNPQNWTCSNNNINATWVNIVTNEREVVGLNDVKCNKYGPVCCPIGLSCMDDGKCAKSGPTCDAFPQNQNSSACRSPEPNSAIPKNTLTASAISIDSCGNTSYYYNSTGSLCADTSYCECYWENNACNVRIRQSAICMGGNPNGKDIGECRFMANNLQNFCNSTLSKIIAKVTATRINNYVGSCANSTREYPCPATTEMPFFNFTSLIISLIALIAIYTILKKD